MKETAYERTRAYLGPGMAEAREKLASTPDATRLLSDMFSEALRQRAIDLDGILATLPYALAEKASTLVKDPFIWEDFASTEPIQTLAHFDLELGRIAHRNDDDVLNTSWVSASILNLWQFECHRLAGERVYELSVGLGERLAKTELHGLSTDDLKLPYRSIYVVIPAELGHTLVNERSGRHALEGVYITEYEQGGVRRWKLLFWGPPNEHAQHEHDDTLFHFSVELPAGTPLDTALDQSEAFRMSEQSPVGTAISKAYYLDQWRKLFKLVMNAVVYCTWPDAELRTVQNGEYTRLQEQMKKHPKGSHKYERTRDRLKNTPQQRRVVLGAGVRPLGEASAPGNPLVVRTLVSGHWQRFAYGPGRELRKWGWREPFWRGPEEASESNPRRVLESP